MGNLPRAIAEVRDTLVDEPVSPRVEEPRDINLHYCRYVAETVADRLGDECGVEILEDGARGYVHTWLFADGRHYDAECVEGVADYRHLPFFRRHPEAAVHVEPESTDPAALRHRERDPLYPEPFAVESSFGEIDRAADRTYVVAGMAIGLALVLIGMAGEWAVAHHLARLPAGSGVVFHDVELLGEVLVLVAPIVFLLIRPAHRASTER